MLLMTYLYFDGRCREAMEMYASALGGTVEMMMLYAGSPAEGDVPVEWRDKVLHATVVLPGEGAEGVQRVQGTDAPPGRGEAMGGFSVHVQVKGAAEAERIFGLLGGGGEVVMPMQETFWAPRFGILRDRFGVGWMVSAREV